MVTNREVRLASRPDGWPTEANFEFVESDVPDPGDGEVLIRNLFMSVDPYMRGRMNDVKSYTPPFALHETLQGGAVGRVEASNNPAFTVGDHVSNGLGWREWFVSDGHGIAKIDTSTVPPEAYLSVLGGTGFTAYVGLLDLGQPKAGETIFVSAAAGAVGSVVGQLGKIVGCRVVGSAGSDEKVAWLRDELGFDAAFNYKVESPEDALARLCPEGIDVYFENVGGDHLQAALNHMNAFGRIAACGMISQYNNAKPQPGPNNLQAIVRQRLTIRGFIVSDHADRRPDFVRDMSMWLREGQVTDRVTVVEGIEDAPRAFLGLLHGENMGKMLVKL
ncbi:MAG TPA: NADP-dependent oxidoreductase [Tepidiformaceae bacterium]|nr:NADP-dependent oxidoreductase [Tepidiformaceae bacterium]